MKIFVKKLAYKTTEATLRTQFEKFGKVSSVAIVMDLKANRSKGFGFVEMPNEEEANAAIKGLSKYKIDGKAIFVKQAGESAAPTFEKNKIFTENKTNGPEREKKKDRFEKRKRIDGTEREKKKDRFEKRKRTDGPEREKKKDRFEKRKRTDGPEREKKKDRFEKRKRIDGTEREKKKDRFEKRKRTDGPEREKKKDRFEKRKKK